jgi:hypothetical protein
MKKRWFADVRLDVAASSVLLPVARCGGPVRAERPTTYPAFGAFAMVRPLIANLTLAGLAAAGLALASNAALADGGPAVCNNCNAGGMGNGQAGGWNQFWHRCQTDFYRNNTWPEPFLTADKMAIRSAYCIQTDNGWKMQNTIGSFLFDSETQRVNQAGELLVKWIVQQAPVHRRAVFVLKGDTAEATSIRVNSVQAAVAKYADGCVCPVLLTLTEPPGWSAAYIDSITQQFNATIPAPRLPARQTTGNGGANSGGGTGGGGGGGVQ